MLGHGVLTKMILVRLHVTCSDSSNTKKSKYCSDILSDQKPNCPDIQSIWSENVRCLTVISGSALPTGLNAVYRTCTLHAS